MENTSQEHLTPVLLPRAQRVSSWDSRSAHFPFNPLGSAGPLDGSGASRSDSPAAALGQHLSDPPPGSAM